MKEFLLLLTNLNKRKCYILGVATLTKTEPENLLVLLVQSTQNLFAYWQMRPSYLWLARAQLGLERSEGNNLCLTLFTRQTADSTGLQERSHSVPELSGTYYFHKVAPSALYYVELGLEVHDRQFTLLRSNEVGTPPGSPGEGSPESKGAVHTPFSGLPFTYSPGERTQRP
jgi:hypothetical protein